MAEPDPKLDSLIERIVFGKDLSVDDVVPQETQDDAVAQNLLVLSGIDRFHRDLHSSGEAEAVVTQELDSGVEPTWGSLQLRSRLGRGGFGEVYRAWDPALQREVALKLLRADVARRGVAAEVLLEEARTLAKVRHENVVSVFGVETHGDRSGFWMELVEGVDLEEQLQEQGPMNAAEASQVGITLCKALAALHNVGLVHRDVKANNVVREQGGRLVLMDFGTVVSVAPGQSHSGQLSGTPTYMAPETLMGSDPDRRSDIYSLGVLLYRLVSKEFPVKPMPLEELMQAHKTGQRRLLRDIRPDLPSQFCQVIDRALHPDPEQRYQTVGELELGLSAVQAPSSASQGASGPTRRQWLLAAAVVALVAVGTWLLRPSGSGGTVVVDATFKALRDGQVMEMVDGAPVAVDDALWLELTVSRSAHIYVLNRDQRGQINLLFPLTGYELQNPLPGEQRLELPGRKDGSRRAWRVSSDGVREEFVIVASAQRLDQFEQSLLALPQAGQGQGPSSSSLALGNVQVDELMRGVAETMELPSSGSLSWEGGDLFDAAGRLGASTQQAQGTWVRRLSFVHRQ